MSEESQASTPRTLPIISLAPFLDPSASASDVSQAASALNSACRDQGFFYLIEHGIPQATLESILALARSFFLHASSEEKDCIKRNEVGQGGDGARGYQVLGENVTKGRRDWHEGIDWYREWEEEEKTPEILKDGLLKGTNLWPRSPEGFEEVYRKYVEEAKRVGRDVVRAMELALGLQGEEEDEFVRKTERSFWVMRAIGYPPLQSSSGEEEGGISCGEHTGTYNPLPKSYSSAERSKH
jgi:isopenicillin N synthase-like dioxygenase